MGFMCETCGRTLSRADSLRRHKMLVHPSGTPNIAAGGYSGATASNYNSSLKSAEMDNTEDYDSFDCTLKAPFALVISGMPQSGKSTLTAQLLEQRNEIICTPNDEPIDRITYCYTEYQPKFFNHLKRKIPQIVFHKGLPEEYADGSDQPSIMILDDLMDEASKSSSACAAFTRTSHHRNVSLIILVQNFFH